MDSTDNLDNTENALALPKESITDNENEDDILAIDPSVLYHNAAATRIQTVVRRIQAVKYLLARFLRRWQRGKGKMALSSHL